MSECVCVLLCVCGGKVARVVWYVLLCVCCKCVMCYYGECVMGMLWCIVCHGVFCMWCSTCVWYGV